MIASFEQANEILTKYIPISLEHSYNLDRMVGLMDYLGNPQNSYKVVHVTGTSGKTSTCYYLSNLLMQRNKKVGLTVSPHLTEINERVQINLTPLPESEFCIELGLFLDLIEECPIVPTWFELMVALAFWVFAKQGVDYAVVEVGLGGLLDGTNVISNPSKVCVITDIGLDHINILGDTIEKIATQKAGIIQPGNSVFCYEYRQNPIAVKVIKDTSRIQKADLHLIGNTKCEGTEFLPEFQKRNFNLALSTSKFINDRDHQSPLTGSEIKESASITIPGRMEIFKIKGKTVVLDGAHNYQKIHAFIGSLNKLFPGQKKSALISFADGRDYRVDDNLNEIKGQFENIIFTSFKFDQELPHNSVDPALLKSKSEGHGIKNVQVILEPRQALTELLNQPELLVVITGSFYLLSYIRPLIRRMND